jgi:hypothetical protein
LQLSDPPHNYSDPDKRFYWKLLVADFKKLPVVPIDMYDDYPLHDLESNDNLQETYGYIFEEEPIVWCTPVEEKAFVYDDEVTAGELAV